MRISELAKRSGSTPHALRHYESLGLIAAARTRGNYREFDDAVVREVVFITMGRRIGFSLAEIARWLPAYRSGRLTPQQMIEALRERIATIDTEIAERRAQRRRLVDHIAWFRERERRAAARAASTTSPAWPHAKR
jgi:DNA-binding transcriptional MerR regulator